MKSLNYFEYLCFGWAFIAIVTRFLIVGLGKKWNEWEMSKAYSDKKPIWIYFIAAFGLVIVGLTWYEVFHLNIQFSWIIGLFITLILAKISALLFNYERFREFASNTLNDPKKKMQLNISVFLLAIVFIVLGVFVY